MEDYGGNSLAVQWLELCISTTGSSGSIPGQGTKIPQAAWPKKKGEWIGQLEFSNSNAGSEKQIQRTMLK